ncbi:MAG: hypothetical protein Q9169_008482 [Polycauliona sp. 2 TL-2023]
MSIKGEMEKFFGGEERYKRLKVPWKRGVIYYGPPGNGKTISIKAMMHTLSLYTPTPIPTLYVRSLSSMYGPEYSIQSIFRQARSQAPCLLVFEDLDSLVTDKVRSYFLNEVDGLESNDGILMVGSTNHLERLDPGIRKRPSRFDRKFFFGLPDMHERILYCEFWQRKLSAEDDDDLITGPDAKNEMANTEHRQDPDIEFPHFLCKAIASITAGFSFAYIQEAFVATLLAIAADEGTKRDIFDDVSDAEAIKLMGDASYAAACWITISDVQREAYAYENGGDEDAAGWGTGTKDLDEYVLWRVMKKQVKILREELEDGDGGGGGGGKKKDARDLGF